MKRKMLSPFTRLKAKFRDRQGGFTLFEVVLVLILITVLTAVVVSRNSPAATKARVRGQADLLKSQLRYAQARSLNANQVWGMKAEGNNLRLFNGGSSANEVVLPGEQGTPVVYNQDDSDLEGLTVDDFTVSFDELGQPCSDEAGTTPRSDKLTITVRDSRSETNVAFDITPNTGFIQ